MRSVRQVHVVPLQAEGLARAQAGAREGEEQRMEAPVLGPARLR